MAHIHTNDDEHDFTVTGYVVRVDESEPKVLLHPHKKYSMLLPVGGHIELTETPWQAIAHELTEESGYELSQLKVLQPAIRIKDVANVAHHPQPVLFNTHTVPDSKHFHSDIAYGFVAHTDPAHHVAPGEATDLRWLTRSELMQLPESNIYENTRQIYLFIIDSLLAKWEHVDTSDFPLSTPF